MRQSRFHIGRLLALFAGLSLAACESVQVASQPGDTVFDKGEIPIYVTSNGWHSEIVVPRTQMPAGTIPETADFPDALYFSFGWGDETYYPAPDPTFGMTLRAALLPTPAVVHLTGLPAHPKNVFPADEVIEVRLSSKGFGQLVAYLNGSFAREPTRQPTRGLYRFSRFYPGMGEFHLFNTCNTWTARGLNQGGLAIQVFGTLRAEDFMLQVRQLAIESD